MSMDNPSFMTNQSQEFGNYGYNMGGGESSNLCIDDPAKRLYSPGGASNQQSVQNRLGNAQYGPNSDIARRIREQQRKVGLADTVNGMNGEEPKPFRCPVIGCEKAYKNQNGLKYHKSVSFLLYRRYQKFITDIPTARPQQPATPRERRWYIFHRGSYHPFAIPRYAWHGEREALQV
jgi:hypothetical protein